MQSKKSIFDRSFFKSDWRHYWPLFFVFTLAQLVNLPLSISSAAKDTWEPFPAQLLAGSGVYTSMQVSVILCFIAAVLFVMAVFSYLHNARALDVLHALPVRREALFITHSLSAFSMMTLANLIACLIALPVQLSLSALNASVLVKWFLVSEAASLFFLGLSSVCAQITGWLLAVPVIYGGLNVVVIAVSEVIISTAGYFYYGFAGRETGALETWLTPVYAMSTAVSNFRVYDGVMLKSNYGGEVQLYHCVLSSRSVAMFAVYALTGVLLFLCAWLFYRARRSESAGDAIAFGWIRPVALYVISVSGALGLGLGIYVLAGAGAAWKLLIFQLVMGLICFAAVEMLLQKSFRTLNRKVLVGAVALCATVAAITAAVKTDVIGYQKFIPKVGDIESVYVYNTLANGNATLKGANAIEALTDVHRCVAAQGEESTQEPGAITGYMNIHYQLNNGKKVNRSYAYYILPGSGTHAAMNSLINTQEWRYESGNGKGLQDFLDNDELRGGEISYYAGVDEDLGYGRYETLQTDSEQTKELCSALREDLKEDGNLDIYSDINFDSVGFSLLTTGEKPDYYYYVNIRPDFNNTWAVLQKYDLLDPQTAYAPRNESSDCVVYESAAYEG